MGLRLVVHGVKCRVGVRDRGSLAPTERLSVSTKNQPPTLCTHAHPCLLSVGFLDFDSLFFSLSFFVGAAMVNIHGRRCHQQGCDKQPTFGRKGQKASRLEAPRARVLLCPWFVCFHHWHRGREGDTHYQHPHTAICSSPSTCLFVFPGAVWGTKKMSAHTSVEERHKRERRRKETFWGRTHTGGHTQIRVCVAHTKKRRAFG